MVLRVPADVDELVGGRGKLLLFSICFSTVYHELMPTILRQNMMSRKLSIAGKILAATGSIGEFHEISGARIKQAESSRGREQRTFAGGMA